jgi:Mn-dependent DtxR family transcriptional regulator
VSCSDATPWEIVLLVIYCHGWELDARPDRVKRISSKFCAESVDILIRDLEEMGLITVYGGRLILTRKGLSTARKTCERYSRLCEEIERALWSDVSRQSATLKRFMRK